jgi:RimJ/RimL family protein N-acetyltransferase
MQVPPNSELAGPRIRFDQLRVENIYTHFKWNNDPELNRLDSEVPYSKESFGVFKKRFDRMIAHPQPDCEDFEIHAEDGTLIGVAFLAGISGHHLHCSIGLTIGEKQYWGQGYGREAMDVLLRYSFDSLGMHRVTADGFEYNKAWCHLVEGMGFRAEGVDREYLFRDGRFYDRVRYAMLAHEYAETVRPPTRRKPVVRKKRRGATA